MKLKKKRSDLKKQIQIQTLTRTETEASGHRPRSLSSFAKKALPKKKADASHHLDEQSTSTPSTLFPPSFSDSNTQEKIEKKEKTIRPRFTKKENLAPQRLINDNITAIFLHQKTIKIKKFYFHDRYFKRNFSISFH